MGTLPGFLFRQITFKPKPLPTGLRLDGKTVLITGANTGLGLEAAKELATYGVARLILGVRSISKGEVARDEVLAVNPHVDIQVFQVDHESFASVDEFGKQVAALGRLDIVILNAGVKNLDYQTSSSGHEEHVQVNHLATALLSLVLLGPLKRTAQAVGVPTRLTIVSSENHFWANSKDIAGPNILDRMDEKPNFGKGMDRYNISKLMNVLWMRELSSKAGSSVIVNSVNPGFCQSLLHRSDSSGSYLVKIIGWTAAQGGHCLTDAATQHEEGGTGVYLSEQSVKSPSAFVLSTEGKKAQTRLWDETIQLLKREAAFVDVLENLDI